MLDVNPEMLPEEFDICAEPDLVNAEVYKYSALLIETAIGLSRGCSMRASC